MNGSHILIKKSHPLTGTINVHGAKNAVLVIMTSLILTEGISTLTNVPNNADVRLMIALLQELGVHIDFDAYHKILRVDTSSMHSCEVKPETMNKIRASILVMGPLLARFGRAKVAMPGGDLIGLRPINYHLDGFKKMGVVVEKQEPFVTASLPVLHGRLLHTRIVLEYPSVGATENLLMFACLGQRETYIINAALEPEVFDLIDILQKMGASIEMLPGATIFIKGVQTLQPVTHAIIPDRLEAGTLLTAAAITGGSLTIPNARADHLDIFLEKLREMGHEVITALDDPENPSLLGVTLNATCYPQAISIKTAPYPGFPTDLQPLITAALCLAAGTSVVDETVYENRMIHTKELNKMGAKITVAGTKAVIHGVDQLYGTHVIATDIRTSCALVLAGLAACGQTTMTGLHHWKRGYDNLEEKLRLLGGQIEIYQNLSEQESQPPAQTPL